MKKEIYSSAWDSVTMSDECLGEILDSIEDVPVITKRPRKKVSYLAVLTAAVVFMTGGITAAAQAGAFDWIKGFFGSSVINNTEEFSDIVGVMKDFECRSDIGTEISPVGVIFDGDELYCMLKTDKLPEGMDSDGLVTLKDAWINGIKPWEATPDSSDGSTMSYSWQSVDNEEGGSSSDMTAITLRASSDMGTNLIKEGDRITLELGYEPKRELTAADLSEDKEEDETVKIADVSFTLQNGRYSVFNIDYSKYTCDEIPKRQYDFLFDTVKITSLKMTAEGRKEFYAYAMTNDDVKVVLDDGSEVIAKSTGTCSWVASFNDDAMEEARIQYLPTVKERVEARQARNLKVHSEWSFSKPIDPDRIVKIYLDDMCIYKR